MIAPGQPGTPGAETAFVMSTGGLMYPLGDLDADAMSAMQLRWTHGMPVGAVARNGPTPTNPLGVGRGASDPGGGHGSIVRRCAGLQGCPGVELVWHLCRPTEC
jgi:hypothetical protein